MSEQQEQIPWWQRELNARLARRALRREALRRMAVRAMGAIVLVALGLLLVLALAQDTQGRIARRARLAHEGTALAGVAPSPTLARKGTATGTNDKRRSNGTTLTLDPPGTGAAATKGGATLRVTATDRAGAPLSGITIWLTITGIVPYSGAATTDGNGMASFTYQGAGGPYMVHVTATADGSQLAQSTIQVGAVPVVATTEVTGRFYASDDRCTFDTSARTSPLFVERFPTINFSGRPFTDYGVGPHLQAIPAARGSTVIGLGQLNHFNAAFTGSLVVRSPGDVRFTFLVDDAYNLGVGGGASRVDGTMTNPPASGVTALEHLPVVGAFNRGHLEATTQITIHFPHRGTFPYELDYSECAGGGTSMRVSSGGLFLQAAR